MHEVKYKYWPWLDVQIGQIDERDKVGRGAFPEVYAQSVLPRVVVQLQRSRYKCCIGRDLCMPLEACMQTCMSLAFHGTHQLAALKPLRQRVGHPVGSMEWAAHSHICTAQAGRSGPSSSSMLVAATSLRVCSCTLCCQCAALA
jgi:hypothetical protein